ncbi:MAG: bifunctional DNA-formamidopyrimidine glycosylase/DNA-(apurinic or apyrimidinic site) lyase [Deltaproteobacteria bacterium]|jgi:formamidopyrimidine-DNA glycosylase|nr:bifunctional DNA-formamidopyrimidine glycosylase/DNA-(apurinic or apyrimidinic site) lyase [Deltaproteobacteria bacterium]
MPELPEAETMARDLGRAVTGRTISEVLVAYWPIVASDHDEFARLLAGRRIEGASRLGKWVRLDLSGGAALLVHLKMTGQFLLGEWPGSTDGPWPPHARAAFRLTGEGEPLTLFYRDVRKFGRLRAFEADGLRAFLDELALGPDPFQASPEEFHRLVSGKRGALKAVLLDQQTVAGLGNIYVDESLFAAGLSPWRPAGGLSRAESDSLLARAREILATAVELRGSTVGNYQGLEGAGAYQGRHQVYGKSGWPCPRCGETLVKSVVGGRSSVHCLKCQK